MLDSSNALVVGRSDKHLWGGYRPCVPSPPPVPFVVV